MRDDFKFVLFVIIQIVLTNNDTAPPRVVIYSNGKVTHSKRIQMNCYVNSFTKPNILWYKNKHDLLKCSRILYDPFCEVKTGHYKQHYWSNMTKASLSIGDNYTCTAENTHGKSNASFTIPCFETECIDWTESFEEKDIKINVGQSHLIKCQLFSLNEHVKECFKFGVIHHNRSYHDRSVSVTPKTPNRGKVSGYVISYILYNITNASKNDSGVYACFYNFAVRMENSQCSKVTVKKFNVIVTERSTGTKNEKRHHIIIAIAVSVGVVLVGLAVAFCIFCLSKKKLKSQRLYESDPELRWDVFVSYSSKDFDWVKELCKTLEQPPFNLTVCLHQRDWEVGRTILDNMAESIYCSRKTLLIVSKSYLESSFCMQELNIAMDCESQKVLKDRIIVIKLDDVSLKYLPKTLRQKSYLDFSNNEQRKHYKTKLLKALPRRALEDGPELQQQSDNEESENGSVKDIKMNDMPNNPELVLA